MEKTEKSMLLGMLFTFFILGFLIVTIPQVTYTVYLLEMPVYLAYFIYCMPLVMVFLALPVVVFGKYFTADQ